MENLQDISSNVAENVVNNFVAQVPIRCRYCKAGISSEDYFCPNCGKQLKVKPSSTGFWNQAGIYLLSFLLPPFGLWPGIKYLRQPDKKAKMVGLVAILLTVISIALSFWIVAAYMDSYSKLLNGLPNGVYKPF
jgi:hypothetical protein